MKTIAQIDKSNDAPLRSMIPRELFVWVHREALDRKVRPNRLVIEALESYRASQERNATREKRRAS